MTHSGRWMLLSGPLMASGAAYYLSLSSEPSALVVVVLLTTTIGLFLAVRWFAKGWSVTLPILLLWAAAGYSAAFFKTHLTNASAIPDVSRPVQIEGVLQNVEYGEKGVRLVIKPHAIEEFSKSETPKLVRITHRGEIRFQPGRPLKCRAILLPPPAPVAPRDYNFEQQAYFQELGAVGFALGDCALLGQKFPHQSALGRAESIINAVRRKMAHHVFDKVGGDAGGLAVALTTGDRSYLTPSTVELLRASGLAHLIAISGLHMGLVGGVVFFGASWVCRLIEPVVLRIPVKKIGATTALISCTGYLLMSGASVATQRAYIMAAIAFLAILFDRPAITFRSFTIAMVVVTAMQPQTVVTPGYQMSFAATAALISLYEAWPRNSSGFSAGMIKRVWRWLTALFATSTTASLATAPFAVYHFDRLAVMSIPANLAVMPIVSLWAAPSAALAAIFSPIGLETPFLKSFGLSLETILSVTSSVLSASPGDQEAYLPTSSFICVLIALVCFCVLGRWYKIIALVFVVPAGIQLADVKRPSLIITRTGEVYARTQTGWTSWYLHPNSNERSMKPLRVKEQVSKSDCDSSDACVLNMTGNFQSVLITPSENGASITLLHRANAGGGVLPAPTWTVPLQGELTSIMIVDTSTGFKVTTLRQSQTHPRPWQNTRN